MFNLNDDACLVLLILYFDPKRCFLTLITENGSPLWDTRGKLLKDKLQRFPSSYKCQL